MCYFSTGSTTATTTITIVCSITSTSSHLAGKKMRILPYDIITYCVGCCLS